MPYYSRGYSSGYRRRRNYRRRYPRKGNGNIDLIKTAKAAYQGVKYLKGLVNVEKKAVYANASDTVSSSGVLNCLNLIAQGDAEENRSGDSIMMKMIHVNFKININASASHTNIRVMLFLFLQPQGATPTVTFPLQTTSNISCYNNDNAGLYTILYDKTFQVSITGNQEISKGFTRKFYQLHETFDGSTAAVGDIQRNALWLLAISDEGTNVPTMIWRSELLFVDN